MNAPTVSREAPVVLQIGGLTLRLPPWQALAMPVIIVLTLAMMILPLPPLLLDLLFSFNIALSIVVLLVSAYTVKPLEFAVFPSVLLVTTSSGFSKVLCSETRAAQARKSGSLSM